MPRFEIDAENFEQSWTEQQCRTRINEVLGDEFLVLGITTKVEGVQYPCRRKQVKEWCDYDKVSRKVTLGGFMGHTCTRKEPTSEFTKVDHYNKGKIEAIDVIEDWGLNFNLGSVLKYICRREAKDTILNNLKKAEAYLRREINNLTGNPGWGKRDSDS